MNIIIGSRGSDLALWQAHHVRDALQKEGHEVEIRIIKTKGDRIQHLSFDKMEGKGFFTKEIEAALLSKEIDLAVHSHKDLETTPPEGLKIAAVSRREDPTDTLLIRKECIDDSLPLGLKKDPVVGTSSARRQTQIRRLRDDVSIKDLRGNVPTRIGKLRDGQYDAIILASAGIKRLELDLSDLEVKRLDPEKFVPAPAQGVLGLQIRNDDRELEEVLKVIHQEEVFDRISIERDVLRLLDGGCQLPLGVYCTKENGTFNVMTAYARAKDVTATVSSFKSNAIEGFAASIVSKLRNEKG